MKFSTAVARILSVATLMSLPGPAAAQPAYPNKPIRIISPYTPGGTTSILARLIGQKLTDSWGQPAIVDNRPGGSTLIGTEAVAKSPPDGYTLLLTTVSHVIFAQLLPAPYDPIKDFAAVATLTNSEFVIVLHPSVPANNLQDLIALAKSRPGQFNYASAGSGGLLHLAIELFNSMTGVKIQHIPYKGSAPVLTDLIGGQVQLAFIPPVPAMPHIKSGRLKAIAITGATRMPALPQVPTISEAGLPGFDVKTWSGILAPAGTPKAVADKLSAEIVKIMALPDIREKLVSQGLAPFISTPEQLAAMMKADMAKYAKVIKTANIKFEN